MSPTQCDSAESNPTQSSPLSSPPPLSFARPRFDSTPRSSSPLASNEPTTTLDLSREEDSTPCQSRRLSSASLEANRSVLGETTVGKRGGGQNEGVNEGLSDTAIGIQSGLIGGGFGPYPSPSSVLFPTTSTTVSNPLVERRAFHSHGSDSAIDLFSPTSSYPHDASTTTNFYHDQSEPSTPTPTPSQAKAKAFPIPPLYLSDHKFLSSSSSSFDSFDDSPPSSSLHSWRKKTPFEYLNAFFLFLVVSSLLVLLLIYPVLRYGILGTWSNPHHGSTQLPTGWNVGGINASGQVPKVFVPGLIDVDTPEEAWTRRGFGEGGDGDGEEYRLVFSDEFEREGRTFWKGDDPFWEAVDLHYWQTQDYEWYDPDSITTRDGKLEILLSQEPIHGLNFRSGMLQSWNKFCFTGGLIEVAMSSPGDSKTMGFWPGIWTLGNLGRAGFGATNDGVWPYSYTSCDVGTLPNQTFSNHTPSAALHSGLRDYGGQLSYLRGQRFSACTCPGEDHPGPNVSVGRGAPEIDLTEQQVDWRGTGSTSQSIQFAPMDAGYRWLNTTPHTTIFDSNRTFQNTFQGATFQESASVITLTDTTSYDGKGYTRYGFEYEPGPDGRITWFVNDTASWRILASAMGPNEETQIGQRLISTEPMSININLAISKAFQTPNWADLTFPGTLRIDYIRVYQKGEPKIGCDPADHPTSDYINRHLDIYTNPNLTTFPGSFPRNRISDEGC
ncbi:uncharacterized protein JCM6883_003809 [Sporobolomyces salmoneus]|uniref:uncharacterized protein n=1 Tax=Sporobolomyces salmoneus TaxID=183962 RepID=UPI00316BAA1D